MAAKLFTHQLITEATYKLMLEKQRKEIHLAIAEEYESCSAKFESEVLAYHWLRSGDVARGCALLELSAKKAIEIGALKEAVNSLAQAISVGKESPNRPLWFILHMQNTPLEILQKANVALDGLELLGDKQLAAKKRSRLSVDMLIRKYGECDDTPK